MKRHIRPVAKATGINKNIGWHTFRHSFGTLLKANGEDVSKRPEWAVRGRLGTQVSISWQVDT